MEPNLKQGYEEELAGVEARLAWLAEQDDPDPKLVAAYKERVGLINDALGTKKKARKESRPAKSAEKRPG